MALRATVVGGPYDGQVVTETGPYLVMQSPWTVDYVGPAQPAPAALVPLRDELHYRELGPDGWVYVHESVRKLRTPLT